VTEFAFKLSEEFAEQIAFRVSELLLETVTPGSLDSPWFDVDGACAYLGLSTNALYKLSAAGAIPCRKKAGGQGLRFHRDELDSWMRQNYPRVDRLA